MRKTLFWLLLGCLVFLVILPSLILTLRHEPKIEVKNLGVGIRVKMHDSGKVRVMPLEEYLVGVIAGEMPAAFQLEALKAQAVAARTYTLKKLTSTASNSMHPDADICTDSSHCQAWMSKTDMRRKWGIIDYWRYYNKMKQAVEETAGLVATYNGRLIEPVYHSTSSGRTEEASEVWKYSFSYLQSVPSKWDTESPRYKNATSFSFQELDRRLGTNISAVPVSSLNSKSLIQVLAKTVSGRAKIIRIGNKTFPGTELRRLLDLSSTAINWSIKQNGIVFITQGYGHGVGMSQYGANGMAREGKDFKEILTHYYRGISIETW